MNLEPVKENPFIKKDSIKEQPTAAQIHARAQEEMRSLKELFSKSEAELADSGTPAHPELEALRLEAEQAHLELKNALREAERFNIESDSKEQQRAKIAQEKQELENLVGDERTVELFTSNEEIVEGSFELIFANQLHQLRSHYGEEIYKKVVKNYGIPIKDLHDFIEAITDGGVELDPADTEDTKFFDYGGPTELLINTYRLMKPGLAKDKLAAIEHLVEPVKSTTPTEASSHASRKYIRVQEGFGFDKDDKDYILDKNLAVTITPENRKDIDIITEQLAGRQEKDTNLETFIDNFNSIFSDENPHIQALDSIPSAKAFSMHHEQFNRSRTIQDFKFSLKKKMAPIAAAFYQNAFQEADNSQSATEIAKDKTEKLLEEAVRIFLDVHSPRLNSHGEQYAPSPIDAMRGFNDWISSEANASFEKGEFHVGRDTLMTTYTARHAREWGKMSGKERAKKIRHVDVSRTIVNNTPKAILANYLRQNGIHEDMMGVDTGYRGTGPQDALLAVMSSEKRQAIIDASSGEAVVSGMDPQIKLMEVNAQGKNRTVEYENKFDGIVDWMELLPKYTERSQFLAKSFSEGSDRLLVISSERNPSEQLLAWVVQSAVWREFAPKDKEKQP
ncbi:MAG: hypothetical protein WCK01_03700 [Candidatus Uhrbacteria bacterium]